MMPGMPRKTHFMPILSSLLRSKPTLFTTAITAENERKSWKYNDARDAKEYTFHAYPLVAMNIKLTLFLTAIITESEMKSWRYDDMNARKDTVFDNLLVTILFKTAVIAESDIKFNRYYDETNIIVNEVMTFNCMNVKINYKPDKISMQWSGYIFALC